MSQTIIHSIADLRARIGEQLGVSEWLEVTQERINQFAEATGDHQWIHVDAERAARESPFKTTIAHGFLTLSLLSTLAEQTFKVEGVRLGVNYGLNRIRFITPVPSGAKIRAVFTLASVEDIAGGAQATLNATVEREGSDKPCCAAEWLVRYYQ